jgi:hypothetical protein
MNDESKSKPISEQKCFIVTPIGEKDSPIRRATDGLIQAVIKPVMEELGFNKDNVQASHEMKNPGSITQQVINRLLNDDLVIANLTGHNPNVIYEIAVRHAAAQSIVFIAEEGTDRFFDTYDERTMYYMNDPLGCAELKPLLKEAVKLALDGKIDNPIYMATRESIVKENINPEDKDALKYIFDELKTIKSSIISKDEQKNKVIKKIHRRKDDPSLEYETTIFLKNELNIDTWEVISKAWIAFDAQSVVPEYDGFKKIIFIHSHRVKVQRLFSDVQNWLKTEDIMYEEISTGLRK